MKEKKKSAASWILEWAGQKRSAYVWSVVLAVGNVIFKIIYYRKCRNNVFGWQ